MRLINTKTLQVEGFFGNVTPSYAILSHTWSDEEVSLQLFQEHSSTIRAKAGYRKIKNMCELALKRGLRYAWVDTCCIDKESSTELSEAINSMFRWYEEAEVCFVYLADIPSVNKQPSRDSDVMIGSSRWFTRGWTLQELLAPRRLEFYALDWTFISARTKCASHISAITGINEVYLLNPDCGTRHSLLLEASVAERMSWASTRETSKKEDIAYCLLGIFGISMPLLYGEGTKAFLRLQEEILRTSFDSSILAWHIQNSTLRHLDNYSPWWSALKMLVGYEHPWSMSSQPPYRSAGTGLLASEPALFHGCNDIIGCDVQVDWTVTSQGLQVTLPISQNKDPYAIIPCRLRDNPWGVLAVPLKGYVGATYSRQRRMPVKVVSHHKWYQWPRKPLILQTKDAQNESEEVGCALWIRSLPQNTRLLDAHTAYGRMVGERWLRIPLELWERPYEKTLAVLLLEDGTTSEKFSIIIGTKPLNSFSPLSHILLRELFLGEPQSLECHFTGPVTRDSLVSLRQNWPRRVKTNPSARDLMLHCIISEKNLMGLPVFEIDVKHSSSRLRCLCLNYKYTYMSEMKRIQHSALQNIVLLLDIVAGRILLEGVVRSIGSKALEGVTSFEVRERSLTLLTDLVMSISLTLNYVSITGAISHISKKNFACHQQYQHISWMRHLADWALPKSKVLLAICSCLTVMVFVFPSIALISCFFPNSSDFIRNNRWILAFLLGIFMTVVSPLADWGIYGYILAIISTVWNEIRAIRESRNTESYSYLVFSIYGVCFMLGLQLSLSDEDAGKGGCGSATDYAVLVVLTLALV